ncbi:glutathionylspermidine synthase family protein [Paenibacillus sp.]|jgi:glutathionylspermidine synthase|uniref:glutathionylspermidine synthase family protein n=1 Tax=Paenibacillus sp. TaxID=58172 RepID=UPI002828C8AC|nr:glutathionylspermidine synthase family protein [Paenibacillus sp.]MDR0269034.1 glutathionylspermidine synthase family protein [Paenibacillus sp.]
MTGSVFVVLEPGRYLRQDRVKELGEMGFTWANLGDEKYWLDQLVVMNRTTYEELEQASARLWRILDRTVRYVHGNRVLYELIGIPPILWDMLDICPLPEENVISRYARFDFAISHDGSIKLYELNADTPTGYVEASIVTPWMCREAGIDSPNVRMKDLIASAWSVERPDTAACVAYGEHLEDSGTIDALVRHSGLNIRCVDCLELSIDEGIVQDGSGREIKRMFALYPKEWMAVDDGGDALAFSIETGKLTLFNSPHSILLQSKGLLAAAWGLFELGLLYTEEERQTIEKYILPTYNKPVFSGNYVSKSMFGREGGSVQMFGSDGELEIKDEDGFDTSELFPSVYQMRANLPEIGTAAGSLRLLTGMFVINGEPCGLLGRAGGLITGNTSQFIAIGVR